MTDRRNYFSSLTALLEGVCLTTSVEAVSVIAFVEEGSRQLSSSYNASLLRGFVTLTKASRANVILTTLSRLSLHSGVSSGRGSLLRMKRKHAYEHRCDINDGLRDHDNERQTTKTTNEQ